jgi:glycosyltransferase involved in cell wall biosynthesis
VENLPVPPDRRVWQECIALRAAGYHVSVICPKGRGYYRSEEIIDDVHIYRHALPLEASGLAGFLVEYAAAFCCELWLTWRIFLTRGFDIIQACNPPDTIWMIALPFCKLFGRKFVFDHHDPFTEMFGVKFPRHWLIHGVTVLFERMSIRTADMVITTSEALKKIAIERAGIPAETVHLVRSCPDLQKMRRLAPDPEFRQGAAKVVIYVGIMGVQDGVDILLKAACETLHTHGRHDVRYLLVGDGPELGKLKRLARDLDVETIVTFTGFLTGDRLLAALSSADLGACPDPRNPYNEQLSMNKVLEYMAMGLPIVMFELSEGRAIAADSSLYVSGGDDPRTMAQAILELLDDPERCRRMGTYGRDRAERMFDWKDHRRIYLDAFARL